uniref:DNA polymerase alpha subunit B n=1 Tax=Globodera pallida TaxID=36090 RepID=A0A183CIP7_GLOPA
MAASAEERDIGGMDVPFVEEQLNEFNCSMSSDDEVEEMVHKMNAISTTYAMDSVDFMDGLIAFMKNCKKTEVSMRILDDYEQQILLKLNNAKSAPKRAATDLRKEREVLRELSFATDFAENVAMDETVEDGAAEQHAEFEAAFDDDKNYTPQPKIRKTTTPNGAIVAGAVGDGFGWPVKSSYTGAAFVGANANGGGASTDARWGRLPTLRVISECDAGAYTHGYGNIFNDICAIVPCGVRPAQFEHAEDDAENQQQQHLSASTRSLIGTILPPDGNCLSFENALLFTESRTFRLDFEHVDNISIYPGMKISAQCLIDDTPGGLCRVQSVIEPSKLQMADLEEDARQQQHMAAVGQLSRLKVVIACGPFLTGGTSNSDQFVELLNSVATAHANVLILCGPFVPQAMELSTESPEAIFANLLIEITKRLGMHAVRVLILPNAQSDLNSMPYFPTPPLIRPSKISLPNNVTFLPDPAVFEVHSVRFAVSSSEILMHLCRKEIYKSANVENEDRMRRLISHLFRARSIYPLYPADQELPLSLSNAHAKLHLAKRPHVMILPSLLQPVTKVVDDCVVINPGRFDRGKGVGTFSVLDLDLLASARASNDAGGGGGTSIAQFCEVSLFSTQRC